MQIKAYNAMEVHTMELYAFFVAKTKRSDRYKVINSLYSFSFNRICNTFSNILNDVHHILDDQT